MSRFSFEHTFEIDTLKRLIARHQALLAKVRLAFVPIVNPAGFLRGSRGNGQNVDLMRNAPIEAKEGVTFLVGGQRISKHLPWYHGDKMEGETRALVDYVKALHSRSSSLQALDAHSGFGLKDHLWFPHAHTREPFGGIGYVYHLHKLFETSYPYHGHYQLAPQSHFYLTHRDIWEYPVASSDSKVPFVPLTLEMGSWAWVRKNPRQLLKFAGYFNPQVSHRHHRILRRHVVLMQFLLNAAYGEVLEQLTEPELIRLTDEGLRLWFNRGVR